MCLERFTEALIRAVLYDECYNTGQGTPAFSAKTQRELGAQNRVRDLEQRYTGNE